MITIDHPKRAAQGLLTSLLVPINVSGNEFDEYHSELRSWIYPHKMKKALVILALLIVSVFAYLVRNHTNYGAVLPPGLPSDIPIVEGQVISGRRTLFEDGRGYVVDIRTDLSYGEVLNFYAERYVNGHLTAAPGMGAEFSVADFRLGSNRILLEIHSKETTTHVTMAIHLGKWW